MLSFKLGVLPSGIDLSRVVVEPTKDSSHGDMATNSAMVLAKEAKVSPRETRQSIGGANYENDMWIDRAEVAGPGFVNMKLKTTAWADVLRAILQLGSNYGRSQIGLGA